MKNKKGIATLGIMLIFVIILIAFYIILFLPIPSFTKLRTIINYFMIILLWFLIQGILIFCYYKAGFYIAKGVRFYKNSILKWTMNVERFIITHT